MKDLIWTIIGIWFFYRLIVFFRSRGEDTSVYQYKDFSSGKERTSVPPPMGPGKKREEGEYIDFEEIPRS